VDVDRPGPGGPCRAAAPGPLCSQPAVQPAMAMATSLPRDEKPTASTISVLLLALLATGAISIPFPWSPPSLLPSLNGSAFPPFRTVFFQGECTANDDRGAINQNKTCFSCFRIPTVLAGQTPGVLHAFAEARRGVRTIIRDPAQLSSAPPPLTLHTTVLGCRSSRAVSTSTPEAAIPAARTDRTRGWPTSAVWTAGRSGAASLWAPVQLPSVQL
jgi:hypothetical protein